ncbi:hypothetical protein PsorP6_007756 [Peronosclerospora sorghi]|uniref:Uncharacterized protein n=1 Tax=Peronosclerospora sorghi TaxID=230839 RepID=A0ACC0WAE1_9STRA|nr:hypothetical protein PsorP6_007756 [Peronosclerospora sorghi]
MESVELEAMVLKALASFYQRHMTNPQEKKQADAFLRGFQLTPEAFEICGSLLDQLLGQSKLETVAKRTLAPDSVPVAFFSAQTLARKLRRQHAASSLDANFWTQRIITWLSCPTKLPKLVITQLLLALVALLPRVQTPNINFQASQDAARQCTPSFAVVFERYRHGNGQSVVGYALVHLTQHGVTPTVLAELLLLLVEEVDDLTERTARQRMQNEVDAWAPVVLDKLLPQLMHEASNPGKDNSLGTVETQETVLRALTSWLRYVAIASEMVVRNPLLLSLLDFFAREELFDAAVDLAVELVRSYAQDNLVVQWVTPRLLSLRGVFGTAAEAEDVDTCLGLCRIFTEIGESYLELLLQQHGAGNDDTALVDLLLDCMSHNDADVADVTIPFWFKLLAELQQRELSLRTDFKPRLERLAGLCMQKLQFQQEFTSLPADKQQDFKAFRQELGDILRECCELLGVEAVVQHCVHELNQICQMPPDERRWEEVEARLYCFRSIAREVEKRPTTLASVDAPTTLIFQHLEQFAEHPAICYTSCLIVSRYAGWLRMHPTLLLSQMKFLHTCITKSAEDACYAAWEVARAAAAAIRSLAMDCWSMIGDDLLAFYLHLEHHDIMEVEDQVLILEGLCAGVASVGDLPRILFVLEQIVKGIGQRLTTVFAAAAVKDHVQVVLDELLRLICIYEYLDITRLEGEKHPLVLLTEQFWPLFNQMLVLYRGHDELVERVCRCYKRILRCCGKQVVPLLPQLVDNLLAFYQAEPKSSYLYSASMVLKFVSPDDRASEMETLFARMLWTFIETTLPLFASRNEMEARPDVIEEFFYLMERAVRCVPHVLAAPAPACVNKSGQPQPVIASVVSSAVAALALSHNDANKAVLWFLEQVYVQSQTAGAGGTLNPLCACIRGLPDASTKTLVSYLLRGIVLGVMAPSRVDGEYGSAAGLLVQLAKVHGPKLQHWIAAWFDEATGGNFASAAVNFLTRDETQEFQTDLFAATSERAFRRKLRHFSKLCASRNTSLQECER